MYDYWLGGKDNFAADRKAAEEALAAYPGMAHLARANRAFLGALCATWPTTVVFGSSWTSAPASQQQATPMRLHSRWRPIPGGVCRFHPVVLSHARALLTSAPEGATDYIDADLRDTGTVLREAARTLDFTKPVAVTMLAILHAIGDEDRPYEIVAQIMKAVPSGSYLAISHIAADLEREKLDKSRDRVNRISHQQYTHRNHAEVLRFFDGMEMVEPGLVELRRWRPAVESKRITPGWCGLGCKP